MLSCKCWLSGLAYSMPLSNRIFSGTLRSAPAAISCAIVKHRSAEKNFLKAAMKRVLKCRRVSSSNDHHGTDCGYPYAGLVEGADGNLYGTAGYGKTNNGGAVFKLLIDERVT